MKAFIFLVNIFDRKENTNKNVDSTLKLLLKAIAILSSYCVLVEEIFTIGREKVTVLRSAKVEEM